MQNLSTNIRKRFLRFVESDAVKAIHYVRQKRISVPTFHNCPNWAKLGTRGLHILLSSICELRKTRSSESSIWPKGLSDVKLHYITLRYTTHIPWKKYDFFVEWITSWQSLYTTSLAHKVHSYRKLRFQVFANQRVLDNVPSLAIGTFYPFPSVGLFTVYIAQIHS